MTTTVIDLSVERSVMLNLGRVGENGVTEFVFDYANWTEEFGEGVLSLVLKRQGDAEGYPKSMTVESRQSTWVVDSTDVGVEGIGEAQLTYTVNGDAKKSVIYLTRTCPSIEPVGPAPDPYQSWLDQMIEAKEDAENAAERAETAAENLDTKGYYPDMHVGTADNLLPSSYQTDSTPYLLRRTPYGARERGSIVGGSIVWNQLFVPQTRGGSVGVSTSAIGDGAIRIYGTATAIAWLQMNGTARPIVGHKYFADKGLDSDLYSFSNDDKGINTGYVKRYTIGNPTTGQYMYIVVRNGTTIDVTVRPKLIDLTLMFGSTIADYIYAQEQAAAGAGVALAKAWAGITADYYPYDAGSIKSVEGLTAHKTTGFNQWDEEWEVGDISATTGQNIDSPSVIRTKNYISVFPNATYFDYIGGQRSLNLRARFYDANKNYIGSAPKDSSGVLYNNTFVTPDNCYYMRFTPQTSYGRTYNNDICINISDPSKNGTYEPYTAHTYPLDSSLTLRGIPKLVDNQLVYDGDIYPPSGEGVRNYTGEESASALTWHKNGGYSQFYAQRPGLVADQTGGTIICNKYASGNAYTREDKTICYNDNYIWIADSSYSTLEDFVASLTGVKYVAKTVAQTAFTAEPYTELQICDPNGTEEWVGANMPVGHDTKYYADLKGKIEDIPDAPSADGTYTLKVTVSNGVAIYSWE